MTKEVHLYMAGNDPFRIPVGNTIFVIHAGLPEDGPPQPPAETPGTGELVKKTPLGGIYGSYIIAPNDADGVARLIEDQPDLTAVDFALVIDTDSSSEAEQLSSVLAGVARSGTQHVVIRLLPDDGSTDG